MRERRHPVIRMAVLALTLGTACQGFHASSGLRLRHSFFHPGHPREKNTKVFPPSLHRSTKLKGSRHGVTEELMPSSPRNGRKSSSGTKTRKKKSPKKEPPFWTVPDDDLILLLDTTTIQQSRPLHVQFKVRGNPQPLRRHRTGRGYVYNPSAAAQQCFRAIVQSQLHNNVNGSSNDTKPLWDGNHTLAVTLHFRMKRPLSHWTGNKRGPGRLRDTVQQLSATGMRTDVDNLAKFVLDSLNHIVYDDDRQVASLHVTKVYDSEEDCLGSTVVCIRLLEEDHVDRVLQNSLNLLS